MSIVDRPPVFLKSLNFDNRNPAVQTQDVPALAVCYGAPSKKSAFQLRFSNYSGQAIRVSGVYK
jgi:hypothetical protein